MNVSVLLLIAAVILFVIAGLLAVAVVSGIAPMVFVAFGLACFAGAHLVP